MLLVHRENKHLRYRFLLIHYLKFPHQARWAGLSRYDGHSDGCFILNFPLALAANARVTPLWPGPRHWIRPGNAPAAPSGCRGRSPRSSSPSVGAVSVNPPPHHHHPRRSGGAELSTACGELRKQRFGSAALISTFSDWMEDQEEILFAASARSPTVASVWILQETRGS